MTKRVVGKSHFTTDISVDAPNSFSFIGSKLSVNAGYSYHALQDCLGRIGCVNVLLE